MYYQAKDICKLLDISPETLRYYEKTGVISPKINEKNNYRYYDAWDINYLFEYIFYRKMDYGSKEVLNFIHHASLQQQIEKLNEKQDYYQKQIDYYQVLLDNGQRLLNSISHIEDHLNKIDLCYCPSYYYLTYRDNYEFKQEELLQKTTLDWLKVYPFVENIVFIPKDTVLNRTENKYSWSLGIKESSFPLTGLKENDVIKLLPSMQCVRTLVDAGDHGMFHYRLLDNVMKFIEEHHFKVAGNPFGFLLTRTNDETGYHRYIEFYVPIEL